MSKNTIGILLITVGILYGMLIWEPYYKYTLGYLIEKGWVTPPKIKKGPQGPFGPRSNVIFYSLILIAAGIYMLWAPLY